jgi:NAD(P)H dehydrogenase (quinone)
MANPPSIVIVYHSGYGHTKVIAEEVLAGASSVAGVSVKLCATSEFGSPGGDRKLPESWGTLQAADCIIFGSPTYMGSVSAEFKRFMDASGGVWFGQGWKDKLAAGFTNSGGTSGDKLNTLVTLSMFAAQHSMLWVSQGLMSDAKVNRLGSYLGAMAQSGNGPAPDSVNADDRASAKLFGERVAKVVVKMVR